MNQNPEQLARDKIDSALVRCGWVIQNNNKINLKAALGVAIREYRTDIGPADYVLFVDGQAVGIIEAKRAEEGVHLSFHETQSEAYSKATLKYNDFFHRHTRSCFLMVAIIWPSVNFYFC